MLKRTFTYDDFDGNSVTEDVYFNLSKAELIELQLSAKGNDFTAVLKEIVAAEDGKGIMESFKKIILLSIGKKSADGRRFIKSDEIRQDFQSSEMFSMLFMELATDADAGSAFIRGIVPAELAGAGVPQDRQEKPIETVQLPETPYVKPELISKPLHEMTEEELDQVRQQLMTRGQNPPNPTI